MKKIKRINQIERLVKMAKLLSLVDHSSSEKQLNEWIHEYKTSSVQKKGCISAESCDEIVEAIKTFPGYSAERFMLLAGPLGQNDSMDSKEMFAMFLSIAYIMLSIVDPCLFEGDSFNGKIENDD